MIPAASPPNDGLFSGPSRRRTRGLYAGASITIGLATGAFPMVVGGAPQRVELPLAVVGIIALCAGLAGKVPGFTIAAVALGTEYASRLAPWPTPRGIDGWAVVEAVALFAMVEIGLRGLDARTIARPEPAVRRAAAWRLAGMLAGAAVAVFVVLSFGGHRLPAPTIGFSLGLVAAIALLGAAELLRRRVTRAPLD